MSVEITWKQNILVTDFHLLKSLLVPWDLVRRHSSVDLADKTLTVYFAIFYKYVNTLTYIKICDCIKLTDL